MGSSPRDAKVSARYAGELPNIDLITIDAVSGGLTSAQQKQVLDGGVFDQIGTSTPTAGAGRCGAGR